MLTHGVMTRDADGDCILQNVTPAEMAPVEGAHTANRSGKRAYPERPTMLDVPTTIGAIASRTTTLRFSPSVYIAPYRHPMITAHEFATLDILSAGRVILS